MSHGQQVKDSGEPPPPPQHLQSNTLRRQQQGPSSTGSSGSSVAAGIDSKQQQQQHQMDVSHCLSQQSPHFETANKMPKGGPCTTSSISSNINGSTSGSSLDNKFSMNLIKFPHHHNNLLGRGGATTNVDDEHQLPFSNQQLQQQQQQLSYSGLGEAMHNENLKLESDQNDISSSLSHFNAPLHHHHVVNNSSLPMHHHHHHHHNHTRFDEVDEDGGDVPGLLQHSTALDEGDKKFNQLQELENSLLMQNLQSNFLKKLDGYSHNPDYRSLNRRSGFIEASGADPGQNSNSTNYFHQHPPTNQLSVSPSSSGGSNNPFQRKITTGAMTTTIATANKATSNVPANNTFHVMNTSTSNQSIRNTTRNHIITDSLPGPESCV